MGERHADRMPRALDGADGRLIGWRDAIGWGFTCVPLEGFDRFFARRLETVVGPALAALAVVVVHLMATEAVARAIGGTELGLKLDPPRHFARAPWLAPAPEQIVGDPDFAFTLWVVWLASDARIWPADPDRLEAMRNAAHCDLVNTMLGPRPVTIGDFGSGMPAGDRAGWSGSPRPDVRRAPEGRHPVATVRLGLTPAFGLSGLLPFDGGVRGRR